MKIFSLHPCSLEDLSKKGERKSSRKEKYTEETGERIRYFRSSGLGFALPLRFLRDSD